MKTLVVMPTYCEAENLEIMISAILGLEKNLAVLVVDDNSPDKTGEIADRLASQNENVHVLHRESKDGLGRAYQAAFDWALQRDYSHIVEMDADGSHQPKDLVKLLDASLGFDLVIGSRWVTGGAVRNWPRYRQAISRVGNAYANLILRAEIRDITAGFRVFQADFLRSLPYQRVSSHGYPFQVEMAWLARRAGGKIREVPIEFIERENGRSKMSSRIVLEALILVTGWGIRRLFRPARYNPPKTTSPDETGL